MDDVEVFLDDRGRLRRVGTLRRHPGPRRERVTYEHDPDWIASPEAFQFDPSLPPVPGRFAPPEGAELFGFLGDSAPDAWGRELMRRAERRRAERENRRPRTLQESDYLLGVPDRTRLGALRFRIKGDEDFPAREPEGVPAMVGLRELLEASRRILRGDEIDEDLRLLLAPGSSLGGSRPKACIHDPGRGLAIAKFPKETDAYAVSRWEAIVLDMARDAGIATVKHELVDLERGSVFVAERFDRCETGRIPFVSAMTMTQHDDGDDDGSYLEIVDVLVERGAESVRDRAEMFRRIAFSILVGNTDDHLRNHGFLWAGRRGWVLSPCYDLNPVPDGPRILRTRIDFDDATASLRLLQSVAEAFVTGNEGDRMIRRCADVAKNWRSYAGRRQAPKLEIDRMAPAFEHEDLSYGLRL